MLSSILDESIKHHSHSGWFATYHCMARNIFFRTAQHILENINKFLKLDLMGM